MNIEQLLHAHFNLVSSDEHGLTQHWTAKSDVMVTIAGEVIDQVFVNNSFAKLFDVEGDYVNLVDRDGTPNYNVEEK